MREVYTNIQLNCYWYSLGKLGHSGNHDHFFWAPTSRNFSEEQTQMKDGWQMDLQQKTVFFLQHQYSLVLASSCFFRDLTQIDNNKGDQASHAPPHTAHPQPQRHQRCGQSFGAQSHRQLMRQRFRH